MPKNNLQDCTPQGFIFIIMSVSLHLTAQSPLYRQKLHILAEMDMKRIALGKKPQPFCYIYEKNSRKKMFSML